MPFSKRKHHMFYAWLWGCIQAIIICDLCYGNLLLTPQKQRKLDHIHWQKCHTYFSDGFLALRLHNVRSYLLYLICILYQALAKLRSFHCLNCNRGVISFRCPVISKQLEKQHDEGFPNISKDTLLVLIIKLRDRL